MPYELYCSLRRRSARWAGVNPDRRWAPVCMMMGSSTRRQGAGGLFTLKKGRQGVYSTWGCICVMCQKHAMPLACHCNPRLCLCPACVSAS
jgi:hypothetical protein